MAAFWSVLLIAVLAQLEPSRANATARNLTCYTCDSVTESSSCGEKNFDPAVSSATDTECQFCKKSFGEVWGLGSGYSRECVQECEEVDIDFLGIRTWTKCCTTNKCNTATSVKISLVLLAAAAGLATVRVY